MKKLAIVCTACLVVITAILVHRTWSEYGRSRTVEAALSELEAIRPPRFKVDAPPDETRTPEPSDQIIVAVDDAGRIEINGREVSTTNDTGRLRAKLEEILQGRAGRHPDRTVMVRAARSVRYVHVSKVVEAVKGAGADPVGLQIEDSK